MDTPAPGRPIVLDAWPIQDWTPGGHIIREPLAYAVGDTLTGTAAVDWLVESLNSPRGELVKLAAVNEAPYNAIVRKTVPSIEGAVTYDYLARV